MLTEIAMWKLVACSTLTSVGEMVGSTAAKVFLTPYVLNAYQRRRNGRSP